MTRFSTLLFLLLLPLALWPQTPTANFTATGTQGCAPLVVQFTNTSTGTTAGTTWSWNFGNSVTSVLQNPSTTFTQPGQYTVTLTATNPPGSGGGSNTKTITAFVTVHPNPVVSWTVNNTSGCPPLNVAFTNTTNLEGPGAGAYLWSFGNSNTSTQQNPTQSYPNSGTYTVSMRATNSYGCIATASQPAQITVFPKPSAGFTANKTSFCTPNNNAVSFTGTATGGTPPYSYYWDFGDGANATTAQPSHTYNGAGPFTVQLVVTDANSCKDTFRRVDYIGTTPVQATFSNTPSPGCTGAPVTFTNTSAPGGTTASWSFGAAATPATSTAAAPSVVFNTAGTYPVTLIATSAAGCRDTITRNIQIAPSPTAAFTNTPQLACNVPATITYTNTSTGGSTYLWRFGDGGTSTAANPTHIFNTRGVFTDTLLVTAANGCQSSVWYPGNVQIPEIISRLQSSAKDGCAPLSVTFTDSLFASFSSGQVVYPSPIVSWFWDFRDGNTNTQANPTHTFNDTGSFWVRATVTTANGCVVQDSILIKVGAVPNVDFTFTPATACVRGKIFFNNTTTGANQYEWAFGDGARSTLKNPVYDYRVPGSFTVSLRAFYNGCSGIKTAGPIVINPPSASFRVAYSCDTPRFVRFTSTAIGAQTHDWDFGDGTTSTALNPTHTYATAGTYNVQLRTTNATYGCADTLVQQITVTPPQVTFTASDTAICKGETVQFTGTFTGNGPAEWRWLYQTPAGWAGDTSQTNSMTHRFLDGGRWGIRVAVKDANGCKDTFTRSNYLLVSAPRARFGASDSANCAPLNVLFTDSSRFTAGTTGASRYWDFGNGQLLNTTALTAGTAYPTRGAYSVLMVVTDNLGCKDTLLKSNYINAIKPLAQFAVADTSVCPGTVVTFNNQSSSPYPLTWRWHFGDGDTSRLLSPTHAYRTTGAFNVRLIATDNRGCSDTLLRPNFITTTRPKASFIASDTQSLCPPPFVVNFTNTSQGGSSYEWAFGNGQTSTLPGAGTSYTTPGIYTVSLVATDAEGCRDTTQQTVRLLGYAGGLTYTPLAGCYPLTVQFTANITGIASMIWDFSDGATQPATGNTITHTYQTPGAYVPKLILSNGQGCSASSTGTDTLRVDGVKADFEAVAACKDKPVQFRDKSQSFFSAVNQQQWRFPGNNSAPGPAPVYTLGSVGTYPVQLVVTNANGCKDSVTKTIQVNPLPVISAGPDTAVCLNDAVVLSASGGKDYEWSPVASLDNPYLSNPSAAPRLTTLYTVVGTDSSGCQAADSVLVRVKTLTKGFTGRDTAVCAGIPVRLRAGGGTSYQWSPAYRLNDPAISNPLASPDSTVRYRVVVRERSCAPDTHFVLLTINPVPLVNAGPDVTIVTGTAATLVAQSAGAARFVWSPPDGLSCIDCPSPRAVPMRTTTYTVTGISDKGCSSSDSVTVFLNCNESQLFLPNTFTPNGDGENDVFYPHGNGIASIRIFRIYNRWGGLVFEKTNFAANDKSAGWDGTQNGEVLPPDAFVYTLEAECTTGQTLLYKGDITLIR